MKLKEYELDMSTMDHTYVKPKTNTQNKYKMN